MRPCLLVSFVAVLLHVMTKGHICRHHDIISLLAVLQQCTACRLAAVAYASSIWFDLTHLTHCQVESLQSKLPVEESMYWFVKTWLVHHLWRRSFYKTSSRVARFDDIFSFWTLDVSFSFLLSLVLSINSPNATTLHSRCI